MLRFKQENQPKKFEVIWYKMYTSMKLEEL